MPTLSHRLACVTPVSEQRPGRLPRGGRPSSRSRANPEPGTDRCLPCLAIIQDPGLQASQRGRDPALSAPRTCDVAVDAYNDQFVLYGSAAWIGAGNRIRTGDPQLGNAHRELGILSHGMANLGRSHHWRSYPDARSPGLAGFCTREAPIEPQSIARHVRSAEATQPGGQRPLRRPPLVSGAVAWLTVSDVAKQLRVSSATVYRLIDSGELRHGRVSNAIRISQADLAAFLPGDT